MLSSSNSTNAFAHYFVSMLTFAIVAYLSSIKAITDGEVVSLIMAALGTSTAVAVNSQSKAPNKNVQIPLENVPDITTSITSHPVVGHSGMSQ